MLYIKKNDRRNVSHKLFWMVLNYFIGMIVRKLKILNRS